MMLNSRSLLQTPYRERREILESIITIIPGSSILASRAPIDMKRNSGAEELRGVFSRAIANLEEGLVLKSDSSSYNNFRKPWVKLKKDYIPGLGDTLDLAIVGAGWDRDRARKLRGWCLSKHSDG